MPDLLNEVGAPLSHSAVPRTYPLESEAQVPGCQFDRSVSHGTEDKPAAARRPTSCQLELSVSHGDTEDIPAAAIASSDCCQHERCVSHDNSTLQCWTQYHCLRAPALTVPGSVYPLSPLCRMSPLFCRRHYPTLWNVCCFDILHASPLASAPICAWM